MKKVEGVEERMIEYDDEVQESDAPGACPSVRVKVGNYLEALENQGFFFLQLTFPPLSAKKNKFDRASRAGL